MAEIVIASLVIIIIDLLFMIQSQHTYAHTRFNAKNVCLAHSYPLNPNEARKKSQSLFN